MLGKVTISETRDTLLKDGKPFFYLADTAWSAFYNAPLPEWQEYLDFRQSQGFNALQIIVLPITHDASASNIDIEPFARKASGHYDYLAINDAYFDRACTMLELAQQRGFVPVLAPLWFAHISPGDDFEQTMPLQAVEPYITYVVNRFHPCQPIYIAAGDTWFRPAEEAFYWQVIQNIKAVSPDALTAIHCNPHVMIPDEFLDSPLVDIVLYQSGHGVDNGIETQKLPYVFAEYYAKKPVKRPIINGEPCYEGAGYAYTYGRFKEFDIRKATWQSLLSGAKAGVTYGAHGIWSWHKQGSSFSSVEFIGMPFDWRTALRFKGAWDVAYARWIFESWQLQQLEPAAAVLNKSPEIRMAMSNDQSRFAIYAPFNVALELDLDARSYDLVLIDLEIRWVIRPTISFANGRTTIGPYDTNEDVLIIGTRT